MKFSCERCQTRYSIGDEKVKGKVLKIRCKTCGNIIVVREQIPTVQGEASGYAVPQQREAAMAAVGGAPASAQSTSATHAGLAAGGVSPSMGAAVTNPSPSTQQAQQQQAQRQAQPAMQVQTGEREHEWYVAIKGKQHGPAKAADIVRLFRDSKITERTYLWHDQLPSWTRLKDLAEFADVVAEGPAPRRGPPPPPSEDGAEIVNFEAARAQRQGQQGQHQQPHGTHGTQGGNLGPVTNDPFAAISGNAGAGGGGGDNAPRESTRVFIMQAGLHNRDKKQKLYAGVALLATLGFVGLLVVDYQLDILGLKSVVDAVAVSTGIKDEPIEPGAEWGDGEVDPTLRCKLAPNPAECVKEAKAAAKVRKKRIAAGGGGVSDADLKGAFGTGGEGAGAGGVVRAPTTLDENGFAKVGTGLSSDEIHKRLGPAHTGPTGPTNIRVETPDVAGTTIDADNAGKVVRAGQPAIQECVDASMKLNETIPGKLRMTLSITTKGIVERAVVNDAVTAATGLGTCLSKAAKRWKFAPPTEAADLEIPLVLR